MDTFQDLLSASEELNGLMSSIEEQSELLTESRHSYMDLKTNLLLNYCVNYLFRIYSQTKHRPTGDTEKQLVKHKSLLEKIRPLDAKVQYQLEKLSQNANKEMVFKPNPASMSTQLTINEKPGIYKPPNMQAAFFEDGKPSKQRRNDQRLKEQLASSVLIENLREEIGDEPVEIREKTSKTLRNLDKAQKKYEEEHYTRIRLSKKEQQYRKRLEREAGDINEDEKISQFLRLLTKEKEPETLQPKKPKRNKKRKFSD